MADPEALYAKMSSGEPVAALQPHEVVLLLGRAERATRAATVDERLGGLRVAATIGGRDGWAIVAQYGRDEALVVRRFAMELAVATPTDALAVVRELAADPDEALSVEALRRLTVAVDKTGTARARSLLGSGSARVRAAASTLLGHVAGPVVKRELQALLADPDPEARRQAAEALDRLEGRRPKRATGPWWDANAVAALEAEVSAGSSASLGAVEALVPTSPRPAPAPPVERVPAPQAPPSAVRNVSRTATAADAADRIRRFARASSEEQASMIAELRALGEGVLGAGARLRAPGHDAELGRGICQVARALKLSSWMSLVRKMLSDPDARVRAEASEAIGHLGGGVALASVIAAGLQDPDPEVQAASMRGLVAWASALGRPDLARARLVAMSAEGALAAARDAALASLGPA